MRSPFFPSLVANTIRCKIYDSRFLSNRFPNFRNPKIAIDEYNLLRTYNVIHNSRGARRLREEDTRSVEMSGVPMYEQTPLLARTGTSPPLPCFHATLHA